MKKTLSVAAIKDGTVIDHIRHTQALAIIHLLSLDQEEHTISVGMNLPSRTMGIKDIIKIENRFLTEKEMQDIAIFAPCATINLIRNYKVEKKSKAQLPNTVEGILSCPNTKCISHTEPMVSVFFVEECKNKIHLRCKSCEKSYAREQFKGPL